MGSIDDDELLTLLLANALGDQFGHIQSAIQSMSTSARFCSETVVWHIEAEGSLIQRRAEPYMPRLSTRWPPGCHHPVKHS